VDDLAERLSRILTMIPYIREHPGIRVRDLAAYLKCPPETILADLNAILLCGVPPYLPDDYIGVVMEGERIYLSFAEHFHRPVNLTFQEAVSLILALRSLPLSRSGRRASERLERRIAALLPRRSRRMYRSARRQLQVGALHRGVAQRVALLEQAIEERREVHMEYYSASRDAMTERGLRPYGIVEHHGEWYVVGHCLFRERELPFRIDRIRTLRLTDRRFEPPRDFDLEKYRRPRMYIPGPRDLRVKLRVAPDLARWVREEQPAGRMRELPDGGLILHLSVSQPQWVISWVMAQAGKVEILAPPALRRKMVEACRAALAHYA